MQSHHWARNFTVDDQDVDYLINLLLEREKPYSTEALALILIQRRLDQETAALHERYKNSKPYNPAENFEVGQRLLFPAFEYASAVVRSIRPGNNSLYGNYEVIAVQFEDEATNVGEPKLREFAARLQVNHPLVSQDTSGSPMNVYDNISAEDVFSEAPVQIVRTLENRLRATPALTNISGKWFPRDLLIEVNIGHLNLAEAVLDINGGGPLSTEAVIRDMGGLGTTSLELQTFSLNYAMKDDSRFDEVGPAGEVMWYLTRLEPQDVLTPPDTLRYSYIEYDESLLPPAMRELEIEINDEHSELQFEQDDPAAPVGIVLTYPHRRVGSLPLNSYTDQIFPTARRTPRVAFTLVDGQDGQEFPGWVVRKERFVHGLGPIYRKYQLPIGTYIKLHKGDSPGKVVVDFTAYRPRSEWVRLLIPKGDGLTFENVKRSIGADYDDLMILGIDDIQAVDELVKQIQNSKRTIAAILRMVIPALGRLTPQGTAHAKTIYSAVNVLRRCPPGPIFATLSANPDFENVGGHYWRLAE